MDPASAVAHVRAHYSVGDLERAILSALEDSGANLDSLTVEDLASVDHFHIGGLDATLELLRLAEIEPGSGILDVGGGLGGAARVLATHLDATVTVLDATVDYCRVGKRLSSLVGVADRVTFRHGDATDMPFAEASFDVVWMQHASMNIENKRGLFEEMHRVLRSGGRIAFHEVMAGSKGPVVFPVPWAGHQSISFLSPQGEAQDLLGALGLKQVIWTDVSESSTTFWRKRLASTAKSGPAPLGIHLLMGADAAQKAKNVLRNLEEDRITVVQAVFERP
jgi:SAM-dependent methyltransferase